MRIMIDEQYFGKLATCSGDRDEFGEKKWKNRNNGNVVWLIMINYEYLEY